MRGGCAFAITRVQSGLPSVRKLNPDWELQPVKKALKKAVINPMDEALRSGVIHFRHLCGHGSQFIPAPILSLKTALGINRGSPITRKHP